MQKHLTYVLLLMSTLLASAVNATAGVRHVWAVHDGEKVERDARQHPARGRNTAWDGRVVRIFGARNEVIAFQMIVEADESGIRELALTLPSLVSDRDRITYKAPEADPTKYVGRPIQIFAVNYMLITTRSHASWVFDRASPAAPPDPTGWKPVQLVPERARRSGLPVAVRPNENQANFRRGLQDHQYLTLARSLGLDALVDEAIAAIVPRVFSEAGDRVSFPETGDPYETVRLRLARAIEGKSGGSGNPAAPAERRKER